MRHRMSLLTRFWMLYHAWREVVGPVRALKFALGVLLV